MDRVDTRASDLALLGVEHGAVVAVADVGSVDALVSVLAVLERGAAYLPLRQTLGRAATTDLLRRSGAVAHLDGAKAHGLEHRHASRPHDIAYILPTSGSSGAPKLVQGTHLALRNLITYYRDAHDVGPGSRALWRSDLSWDTSTAEIFPSLCSGGAIAVADGPSRRDPAALTELIVRTHVGRILLPPLILDAILRCAAGRATSLRDVDDIASGGDTFRVTAELLDHLDVRPDTIIENHYGPTETQLATTHRLTADNLTVGATIPLGQPVCNMRLTLGTTEDPRVFELVVDGPGVAAGYIAAEPGGFQPSDKDAGSTWYRTGDLVTIDHSGRLCFAGRADRQVKVGGVRVELGEIESILLSTRHLRSAVASVIDGRIVVAGAEGASWRDERAARELVRTMSSSGVTVHRVVTVESDLPTDANGKADVRLAVAGSPGGSASDGLKPIGHLRDQAALLLGRDTDFTRSFVANGGDSLAAIELVSIAAGLGVDLRVNDLIGASSLGTALSSPLTPDVSQAQTSTKVGLTAFQRLQLAHHQHVGSTWVHQLWFHLSGPRLLPDLRARWSQVMEDLDLRGLDGRPAPGRAPTTVAPWIWEDDGRDVVRQAVDGLDWASDASPVLLLRDDGGDVVTGWILAHELALDPVSVHQLLWHLTSRRRLPNPSPSSVPLVASSRAEELRARSLNAVVGRPDAGTAASSRRVTRPIAGGSPSQEDLAWVVSQRLGTLTGKDCPVDVLVDGRRLAGETDLSACVGYFLTPVLVATAGQRRALVSPPRCRAARRTPCLAWRPDTDFSALLGHARGSVGGIAALRWRRSGAPLGPAGGPRLEAALSIGGRLGRDRRWDRFGRHVQ
ncbi:non-ribosomal peptide synthetase [Aquihabitans sp. G128]|uniref:non-ribosomal peptide synthetase n=1 Tax=Aquihabitans sp. G128 TaxID=2849779 RepID=UPI001C231C1C|nr:non-ribosomal peptide synthetase [Aquihabitans sp. G128]QXC60512.1 non-ribosomal peptide synthetase [Aquihabitans sp. G128]